MSENEEDDLSLLNQQDGKLRVLLVDDQMIVAEAFRRLCATVDDVEMEYCADPAKAIEAAVAFQPTVILQDLVMPNIDGLQLLSLFRSDPETKSVPIIVLSTKEDPKVKSEAFSIGASDYLVKFPDSIEVLARIRAHSRSYLAQQQRDKAYLALRQMQVELERKNAELEALSCRDGLTGILNRRGFDDYLSKEWLRALREAKELGFLLVDIDFFKTYNDNYGHQGGDECLRRVAHALGAALKRPSDIVARYGGEEFAVVLPDTSLTGASKIAEALREGVESMNIPHGFSQVTDHLTISVGVASIKPLPNQTPEVLIEMADKALYEAKHQGRNGYCAWQPTGGGDGEGYVCNEKLAALHDE